MRDIQAEAAAMQHSEDMQALKDEQALTLETVHQESRVALMEQQETLTQEHNTEVHRIKMKHGEDLDEMVAALREQVEILRRENENSTVRLQGQLERQKAQAAAEISALRTENIRLSEGLPLPAPRQLDDPESLYIEIQKLEAEHEASIEDLVAGHELELEELAEAHDDALIQLQETHEDDVIRHEQKVMFLNEMLDKELDRLIRDAMQHELSGTGKHADGFTHEFQITKDLGEQCIELQHKLHAQDQGASDRVELQNKLDVSEAQIADLRKKMAKLKNTSKKESKPPAQSRDDAQGAKADAEIETLKKRVQQLLKDNKEKKQALANCTCKGSGGNKPRGRGTANAAECEWNATSRVFESPPPTSGGPRGGGGGTSLSRREEVALAKGEALPAKPLRKGSPVRSRGNINAPPSRR